MGFPNQPAVGTDDGNSDAGRRTGGAVSHAAGIRNLRTCGSGAGTHRMNPGALPVSTSAMALMVLVVQEDVKRVDAAIFELRNVHPIDDGRRACRTEPPVQSPNVVIPGRGSHRREF